MTVKISEYHGAAVNVFSETVMTVYASFFQFYCLARKSIFPSLRGVVLIFPVFLPHFNCRHAVNQS